MATFRRLLASTLFRRNGRGPDDSLKRLLILTWPCSHGDSVPLRINFKASLKGSPSYSIIDHLFMTLDGARRTLLTWTRISRSQRDLWMTKVDTRTAFLDGPDNAVVPASQ